MIVKRWWNVFRYRWLMNKPSVFEEQTPAMFGQLEDGFPLWHAAEAPITPHRQVNNGKSWLFMLNHWLVVLIRDRTTASRNWCTLWQSTELAGESQDWHDLPRRQMVITDSHRTTTIHHVTGLPFRIGFSG